ncbi:iron-sulfur cluster assembly 2 homolog, mitochondrial [Stomoxys calcitrans]|uniref:Iron-sulfur cluster assembly 2 homolog, mitochondrial n=1 Tax=Stomoxys calcitrans TaxID=35570 RepID=A0A1I8QBK6_STOCA|nr:iron-sulfur cluster assembly 2 homolog, mitochondrial [Stomoxys calcitrans]
MACLLRNIMTPTYQRCTALTRALTISKSLQSTAKVSADSDQRLLVSDSCIKRLKEICQDGSFLRITVEGGGCSGFQYKFDLDSKLNEDDLQFGKEEAKVVIDNVSLEYCNGATVDYHTELIRSGFRMLANPKAEQGCSCGSSFAIKLD